jgi:hypothetical protein
MAGDTYLAGENGRARITLRNDSPQALFMGDLDLDIQDEQGRKVDPWPQMPGPRAGWPGQERFGWSLRLVEPGHSISETLTFQVPPLEQSRGRTYKAGATGHFSRGDIQHPDRSDNVAIPIEVRMPWPIRILEPRPEQHLVAHWHADRQGYTLRVTDPNDQAIAGSQWGALEVYSGRVSMSGPLQDSTSGVWTSGWAQDLTDDGTPLQVRAWVAARGYLPATLDEMVPGSGVMTTPTPQSPYVPIPTAQPVIPASPSTPDR